MRMEETISRNAWQLRLYSISCRSKVPGSDVRLTTSLHSKETLDHEILHRVLGSEGFFETMKAKERRCEISPMECMESVQVRLTCVGRKWKITTYI
jgi:hypothetical protein